MARLSLIFAFICAIFGFGFSAFAKAPHKCETRTINLAQFSGQNFGEKKYSQLPLKPFEVVLSFDDGPTYVTPKILETLKQNCVKATFFMVGDRINENPQIAREVLAQGHSIGLHSMSHLSMQSLNDAQQIADFEQNKAASEAAFGTNIAHFYRFPFLQDTQNLTNYLNQNNFNVISTDTIAYDWEENADIKSVHKKIFAQLDMHNNSGIILLHDNRELAANALPSLLKSLKKMGYKIVKLEYSEVQ